MTGGVNIYLHGSVSLLAPECVVCLCVCVSVRVISNQSTTKESLFSDLSKLDTLLHKTRIKDLLVLRYQGLTCLDP